MNSMRMIFKYWSKSRKDFIIQFTFLVISTIFYTFTPIFIGRMIGAEVVAFDNLIINRSQGFALRH